MRKKGFVYLLLLSMVLSIVACKPQEQENGSEQENSAQESGGNKITDVSQVPKDWKEPEIFRCRVPREIDPNENVDLAVYLLGKQFLDSRRAAEEQAEAMIQQYGYSLKSYETLRIGKIVNTESPDWINDPDRLEVYANEDIWVVSFYARVESWGGELPTAGMEGVAAYNWNFGDRFVVYRDGNVFSMVSYTEYRYMRLTSDSYWSNPFSPVKEEDWPVAEYIWPEDIAEEGNNTVFPKDIFYFEPLQIYLPNSAIVYEYEAPTEEDSEKAVRQAALELGRMYMEELCSKEYDPAMSGKHEGVLRKYYVKEYKDLSIIQLDNSLDKVITKWSGIDDWESFKRYHRDVSETWFIIRDRGEVLYNVNAAENIWTAEYRVYVKSDDPVWGAGEEFIDDREMYLFHSASPVIVKEGRTYYMVMSSDILNYTRIRWR